MSRWRDPGPGTPSVSVVIPTWNRAELLGGAITSALNQTCPPLEVLVCDDGSTDETREVVQAIGDPRVRFVGGEHSGCPAIPRNRGIRESTGEWLAFLDSDDEWRPEKLNEQLALALRLSCKAVCANAYRLVPGQGVSGNLLSWRKKRVTFNDLLEVNEVVCSSAVVHSSVFDIVGEFPESPRMRAIEDYALWLRVATCTDFAFLKKPLVLYQDDPSNSLRATDSADVVSQRERAFRDFLEWATHHQETGTPAKRYVTRATQRYQQALRTLRKK
jgi:glycosyltransferase involved in cell wall biosynthesis